MRAAMLLPLALLLVLAAPLVTARYNGDLLTPFGITARDNMEAMLSYSPSRISTLAPPLALSGADSECCDCVHGVAKHILESTWKAIDDACANVSCPVLKQRCEWIEAHKDEYTGVLAVELRPFTDGYMYCYGKGSCKHPGVSGEVSTQLFQLDSSANMSVAFSQMAVAAPFLEKALEMRVNYSASNLVGGEEMASNDRFARRRRFGPGDASTIARTSGDSDASHDEKKRSCHSCLRHGVRWVLERSIGQLVSACESTKCPHFQAFCAWAKEHKETVRGMIYAHVQPWKAASGWCAGKGSCHCSKRVNGVTGDESEQTMRNAPFTMGELSYEEEEQIDVQPTPAPVIGGGDHDKVVHKKIILE